MAMLGKPFIYNATLPDDLADVPVNLLFEVDKEREVIRWVGYRGVLGERLVEEGFPVDGAPEAADAAYSGQVFPRLRALYLGLSDPAPADPPPADPKKSKGK